MYDNQKPHQVNSGKVSVHFIEQDINSKSSSGFGLCRDDLTFRVLGSSIIQSLPIGVVVFDSDLKVVESNTKAANLINIDDYIDKSLANGTDSTVKTGWSWSEKLKSVLASGQTRIFDEVGYITAGREKILRIVCSPIRELQEVKEQAGYILIEDITERIGIKRQLANAERLAAIGKHASVIAHELNSPMDGILRYINLALRIVDQENLTKPKEYLDRCQQAILRMVQILSELLEFSRSAQSPLEYANIEQIIEEALKAADSRAEDLNINVLRHYTRDILKVRNGNLFQVFFNIIKNAFESMPKGGELHISTCLTPDNNIVIAEFRDTGEGFAPENKDVIFEPYFTTKGKGTGLGLAICKDIIEKYHGRITAENARQGGSIFTVYLPLEDNKDCRL